MLYNEILKGVTPMGFHDLCWPVQEEEEKRKDSEEKSNFIESEVAAL